VHARVPIAIAAAALGLAAVAVVPTALAATQTTLFVSPSGNDANAGTSSSSPVRTLAGAQALVRSVNQNTTGDVRVQFAGGTYRLAAPLARWTRAIPAPTGTTSSGPPPPVPVRCCPARCA